MKVFLKIKYVTYDLIVYIFVYFINCNNCIYIMQ